MLETSTEDSQHMKNAVMPNLVSSLLSAHVSLCY